MFKQIRIRRERKQREEAKAEQDRRRAIESSLREVRRDTSRELQFLTDIGSYKTRQPYMLSDKEIEEERNHIIKKYENIASTLTVLLRVQSERELSDKSIQSGKKVPVSVEVEGLLKSLIK